MDKGWALFIRRLLPKLVTLLAAVLTVHITAANPAFGNAVEVDHGHSMPFNAPIPSGQDSDGNGEERSQNSASETTATVKGARRAIPLASMLCTPNSAAQAAECRRAKPHTQCDTFGPSRVILLCRFLE
jgi:hypothetical protein